MNKNNLCYCILTLQYIKRHYVTGYLLVIVIIIGGRDTIRGNTIKIWDILLSIVNMCGRTYVICTFVP